MYSAGAAEEIVGEVLRGRRDDLLIATEVRFPMGPDRTTTGCPGTTSCAPARQACAGWAPTTSTVYQLHERDGITPVEETLSALEDLQRQSKVRYVGASNFSAWHLM